MKNMMTHLGYYGSVCYNDEDRIFYGKIEFIRALVSYEGTDVASLRKAFEESVDDYLEMCGKRGIEPEKSLKGSFNVRIGPELHRRLALTAARKGLSLNKYIADLLKKSA
ncbi:MAG: type II toxin-antitoxin system HicB family antitoxin [Deltaproteobacteria bacterium]|nr:type II toxin-antitoxin system HicB family antitoxin [Deltaproteobacteria bacterium]